MMTGIALGLASGAANAISIQPNFVSATVTQVGSIYDYQYTVNAFSSTPINQFALPSFSDANITNITSPTGWTEVTSPSTQFSGTTNALVWTTLSNAVSPSGSLSGFGFTSTYAPVKGPYSVGFTDGSNFLGDPPIPGSPLTLAAVPEPESYAMILAGLGLMGFVARRKQQTQA